MDEYIEQNLMIQHVQYIIIIIGQVNLQPFRCLSRKQTVICGVLGLQTAITATEQPRSWATTTEQARPTVC
jgi:hypothetical protein